MESQLNSYNAQPVRLPPYYAHEHALMESRLNLYHAQLVRLPSYYACEHALMETQLYSYNQPHSVLCTMHYAHGHALMESQLNSYHLQFPKHYVQCFTHINIHYWHLSLIPNTHSQLVTLPTHYTPVG